MGNKEKESRELRLGLGLGVKRVITPYMFIGKAIKPIS
jgi:hypothetical protein